MAPRRRGIEEVKEILRSFRKRFGVAKKTSDNARTSLFQTPQGECLLYNLPPEILLLFCNFLDDASLVCFSYTSKVLRTLFEDFGVFNLDPESFSKCLRWVITSRFEQGVRTPSLFLHSLAASPQFHRVPRIVYTRSRNQYNCPEFIAMDLNHRSLLGSNPPQSWEKTFSKNPLLHGMQAEASSLPIRR